MGSIIVVNASSSPLHVFVSKYNGGNDDWFTVQPNARDSWSRKSGGWEVVAFKNSDDTDRAGRYVRVDSTVTYRSLSNISVN
ncbi:hypothetical protein BD413DRAFT_484570 [Trametes elegans]|nr:hypothetical protein BD413DRAFT_484570 [Trametes elegans]